MNTSSDKAELFDALGESVSKGRINRFQKGSFTYYPEDSVSPGVILSAKGLLLSPQNQRLNIVDIQLCREQLPHEMHFHVRAIGKHAPQNKIAP